MTTLLLEIESADNMETRADRMFVTSDWKRWIAENLLRGAPREELSTILIREGFAEDLARLEVDTAASHPYVAAGQSLARQVKKRDWFLHTRRIMEREHGSAEVERRQALPSENFHREYYALNRPVIIENAISDWPAITKWTPDYLREQCGTEQVEIQARRESNPGYEIEKDAHRQSCQFGEFIEKVFFQGASNDFYMTASNANSNGIVLDKLWGDIPLPPAYAEVNGARDRTFLWVGPAGTVTPLHHDLTNNFMAQVVGRKRIRMVSPANQPFVYNQRHCFSQVDVDDVDEQKFPLFKGVYVHDLILNPGELLFLPVGWWHHVVALDVSITITFTSLRGTNDFTAFYETYGEI